jgi:hypothetical protein
VNKNQREQYGGTVHLFIGTGHILCDITFMPFTKDYNYDTDSRGSISHFIFKSVQSFVLRHATRNFMDDSFDTAFERICQRCFFLQDYRRRSIPPTSINVLRFWHSNVDCASFGFLPELPLLLGVLAPFWLLTSGVGRL